MIELKRESGLAWRPLCAAVTLPYATLMRWKHRQQDGEPLIRRPGPKPVEPLDLAGLQARLRALDHGPQRIPTAPGRGVAAARPGDADLRQLGPPPPQRPARLKRGACPGGQVRRTGTQEILRIRHVFSCLCERRGFIGLYLLFPRPSHRYPAAAQTAADEARN